MGKHGAIKMRKAVFVDRDGVVVKNIPREGFEFPTAPFSLAEFGLYDDVEDALATLRANGFLVILVSNQPDIAHGHITKREWNKIHSKVEKLPFDDIYMCFHLRDAKCACRKPKPGMLFKAKKKWNIDLKNSYMVGDTQADLGAGKAAECTTILVEHPYNTELVASYRCSNLRNAALLVIALERAKVRREYDARSA